MSESTHIEPQTVRKTSKLSPGKLALAVAILCIGTWILAEVFLTILGCFSPHGLMAPNDVNLRHMVMVDDELYRMREGQYSDDFIAGPRINSAGFRGPEFTPKKSGTTRLLALGDSTVFGLFVGEQEAWPQVAESRLKADGKQIEIINMGRVATSSYSTLHDVRAWGEKLEADALIISVGWFNDFQIIHEHPEWDEQRAVKERLFHEDWARANSFAMHSRLYRLWRSTRGSLIAREKAEKTEKWLAEGLYKPDAADAPRRVPISQFRENLTEICEWSRERDIPLFFLTPVMLPKAAEKFEIQSTYVQAIRDVAAEYQATVIDTRALLLERAGKIPDPKETWLDDVHLHPDANREVGEAVAHAIEENLP